MKQLGFWKTFNEREWRFVLCAYCGHKINDAFIRGNICNTRLCTYSQWHTLIVPICTYELLNVNLVQCETGKFSLHERHFHFILPIWNFSFGIPVLSEEREEQNTQHFYMLCMHLHSTNLNTNPHIVHLCISSNLKIYTTQIHVSQTFEKKETIELSWMVISQSTCQSIIGKS